MEKTGTFTANCGKAALVKVTMSSSDALGSKFEQRSISKNTASLTRRHEAFHDAPLTSDIVQDLLGWVIEKILASAL